MTQETRAERFARLQRENYRDHLHQLQGADDAIKKIMRAKHTARSYEIDDLFRTELEEEFGLVGHAKARKLFDIAFNLGHSNGYGEIESYYSELAPLLS